MEKIFLALGLVVTGIVALAFNSPSTHPKEKSAKIAVEQKLNRATRDSLPEENILNGTFTSVIYGKKMKLVMKDDKIAELYVDGTRIPDDKLGEYKESTDELITEARANMVQKRLQNEVLIKQLAIRDDQSRLAKKRNDEVTLLDKMTSGINDANQLKVLELKTAQDKQMKLLRDKTEENELFDQKKNIELRDKFMNDLQSDNNKKVLLLDKQEMLLLQKLKQEGDNDRLFKQKLDGIFKEEDSQKLHQLLQEKIKLEKDLNVWMDKLSDTSKPRNRKIKEKTDDNDDEYKRKQRNIEAKKRDLEAEMRSKEKDNYNDRLKEMAEYRAMLQKELKQTEKQIDKEKKNAEKARKNEKEEREEREEMEEKEDRKENKNRNENKDRNERERIEENRSSSRRDVRIEDRDGKEKIDVKIEEKGLKDREKMAEKARQRNDERRAEMEERRKEDRQRREDMIEELKEDGIIGKDVDDVSIQINDEGMTVNGVKQPEKVFNKYREKFRKGPKKPPTSSAFPKPTSSVFPKGTSSAFPKPTSSVFPKFTSPAVPKPKLQSVRTS